LVCNLQRKAAVRVVEAEKAAVEAMVEAADYMQVDGHLRDRSRRSCRKRVEQVERLEQR
jgi:hypothetical protein